MKKKRFIVLFTIALVVMAIIGFAFLTGSKEEEQVSINGIPKEVEVIKGVTGTGDDPLLLLTSNSELEKLYNSMDDTGIYTYTIPKQVMSPETNEIITPQTIYITANIDDVRQWELSFDYIVTNGKRQLVKGGNNYDVYDIPGKDEYVIAYNNMLLLLDLEKETLSMYTAPTVGKYSYADTESTGGVARAVYWAGMPSFNPSGTKMLYYSQRASYEEGLIWVMDTITKEESMISLKGVYTTRVLQWYDDNTAYILGSNDIVMIDLKTGNSQVVYEHGIPGLIHVGFSYPYLFIPKSGGSRIINLLDNTVTDFNDSEYPYFVAASPGKGYDTLLIYQKPNEGNGYYCEAMVLDMQTGKKCLVTVPEKDTIYAFRMHDENTIIMNVAIDSDSYNQLTYFIEYETLVKE